MILTKFTHLKIVHTAGKNLSIADMLSRDFSSLTNSQGQIQLKTLPPQIESTQLSSTNNFITDRGTEYINQDFTHLCTLFQIRHSPRTPYAPWTNGLVEAQSAILALIFVFFSKILPQIDQLKL